MVYDLDSDSPVVFFWNRLIRNVITKLKQRLWLIKYFEVVGFTLKHNLNVVVYR